MLIFECAVDYFHLRKNIAIEEIGNKKTSFYLYVFQNVLHKIYLSDLELIRMADMQMFKIRKSK